MAVKLNILYVVRYLSFVLCLLISEIDYMAVKLYLR